ncbi:MAG: hypothetical protein GXP37_01175 [Chloroflexi bacterium]|nr:hypothetical protein [Chloroflexota bacterium]
MTSRTKILSRIRHALADAYLPDAAATIPPPPSPPPFAAALIDVFEQALIAVQGQVTRVENQEAARDWLVNEFQKQGVQKILGWNFTQLPVANLAASLQALGIELIPARLSTATRQADLAALADIPVGLTGADAGLARTGSIVLYASNEQGRLASLLPEVHYALLPADRIYADLAAWLAVPGVGERARHSSNTVIITGPSRSADIAQTLTLGAHGPKRLHVLLIET